MTADEKTGDGTGTYKVDQAAIDRTVAQLGGVIEALMKEPSRLTLQTFAGKGGNGVYPHIFTGSGKGAVSATALRDTFEEFAVAMETQLTSMETKLGGLVKDLQLAHQFQREGEEGAALTAAEMMADLRDALAAFGGSTSTTATTPAGATTA
ncbi:hypothetical protein OG786_24485 [Streptomyces sp. NBC_00101]|uniref:hypothetical protein n=1 Tax=Streptomyces sp. NBC_00101 TaxID=2975651 RepID=UPI00325206D3